MICITFDSDWMTEISMSRFLAEFNIPGKATFFLHQRFNCLAKTDNEIAPHPFITDLSDWRQNLGNLRDSIGSPATGIRPHSCVFSHEIGLGLKELGYKYVSQANNIYQDGLAPFRHPWGLWEMPIFYMDNMDFWMRKNWPSLDHTSFSRELIDRAISGDDLYVFDFHPLHIALNTRTSDDYQAVKEQIIKDGKSPFDLAFSGRGARTFFIELCNAMAQNENYSNSCIDALNFFNK